MHIPLEQPNGDMLRVQDFNALDLAQPTNFKAMLKSGKLLWGTTCRLPYEDVARILAALPHQFCFIDAEHTPLSSTILARMVRSIQYYSQGSMVPIVRVPSSSPDLVTYALNVGAAGIIKPHVQTADEARALARLARFPPIGDRSFPPGAFVGDQSRTPPGKTIYDVWNEHIAVICQIEDTEGVKNIDEIAAVPGVDALMVGASDLRFSLGLPAGSMDGDEPCFLEALAKIQKAADANGLPVLGFGTSPEVLQKRLKLGWRAFIVHGDIAGIYSSGVDGLQKYLEVAKNANIES